MRPSEILAARRERVLAVALACGASAIQVFGSVTKGLDRQGSGIDLLVNLPAGTSLLQMVGLQIELQDVLGVKVDLCTECELPPAMRSRMLAEARKLL